MVRSLLARLALVVLALAAPARTLAADPLVPVYWFSPDREACVAFRGPVAALPTYLAWKGGRACALRIEKPWDETFRVACEVGPEVTVLLRELDCRVSTGRAPPDARQGPEGPPVADFHECFARYRRTLTAPGDLDHAVSYCACQADVLLESHGAVPGPTMSKLDTATNARIDARCGHHESVAIVPLDAEWLPVEGEALGFSAWMPGRPKEVARDAPLAGGKTARLRLFAADSGARLVSLSVTRFPARSLAGVWPERALDDGRKNLLAGMSATLVSEREVRHPVAGGGGGFLPGRDVTFKGQHAIAGKVRFLVAAEDDTIYGLLVLVDGLSPDEDFERLVASFAPGSAPRRP